MLGVIEPPVKRAGDLVAGNEPARVMHVMRTYGASGGENQMAQYLAASRPSDMVDEIFAFIYRDNACRALFAARGVRTKLFDLVAKPCNPTGLLGELVALFPRLPLLWWRLARLLTQARVEICVVSGIQAALAVWPVAALLTRRGVHFIYVHRTTKTHGRGKLGTLIYRPFTILVGNSQSVADSLQGLAPRDRVIAVENGVNISRLQSAAAAPLADAVPAEQPTFVAVGRLIPSKNQTLLIAALAIVRQSAPGATLWIVGEGPERSALEAHARALGVENSVFFLGYRKDVPALLARASLFVNASLWEGMSNAVLEAMALGKPSVVVDAPGVSECHEPGVSALVVENDPAMFADAVLSLLGNDERRATMEAKARERVRERYAIDVARARYLDLFRALLSKDF